MNGCKVLNRPILHTLSKSYSIFFLLFTQFYFECYNFYRLQVLLGVIFRYLRYGINSCLEQRREYSVLLKAVKQCQQIKNTT